MMPAVPIADSAPRRVASTRVFELLAVGGLTFVLLPIAWVLRAAVGLDSAELTVGFLTFYAAYVINDPHFTVTYVLFYKDIRERAFATKIPRAQRARFIIAGFVVPIVLAAWALTAITFRSAQLLGWMVQLMYLLVGWHYVKQGFGVVTVLSARRGIRIAPRERAALLFHAFAGWAFSWANPTTSAGEFEEKGVVYWAPAHPRWFELLTGSILAISVITLIVVLVRSKSRLPRGPLAMFLVTIWSWGIFSAIDPLFRYVIPGLHSIQYFYFVWLMKRNEARAEEGPPSFGRPVVVRLGILGLSALALSVMLFHAVPTFLDGAITARWIKSGTLPEELGPTPFLAAFFVFVNVHHYFMDTVIWRRENADTRWMTSDVT